MKIYEVRLKDKNITIEVKTEKEKCIYCGDDVIFHSICKTNLNNKKIFYKEFDEDIKIEILYKRMMCKNCKRTFSKYSCGDIKKDLISQKKEIQKSILKKIFERGVLKYDELEKNEIKMLKNENINYKNYRVLERKKTPVNQFDKKMIKVILINLESFETKELKYKEVVKKDYIIK